MKDIITFSLILVCMDLLLKIKNRCRISSLLQKVSSWLTFCSTQQPIQAVHNQGQILQMSPVSLLLQLCIIIVCILMTVHTVCVNSLKSSPNNSRTTKDVPTEHWSLYAGWC